MGWLLGLAVLLIVGALDPSLAMLTHGNVLLVWILVHVRRFLSEIQAIDWWGNHGPTILVVLTCLHIATSTPASNIIVVVSVFLSLRPLHVLRIVSVILVDQESVIVLPTTLKNSLCTSH